MDRILTVDFSNDMRFNGITLRAIEKGGSNGKTRFYSRNVSADGIPFVAQRFRTILYVC